MESSSRSVGRAKPDGERFAEEGVRVGGGAWAARAFDVEEPLTVVLAQQSCGGEPVGGERNRSNGRRQDSGGRARYSRGPGCHVPLGQQRTDVEAGRGDRPSAVEDAQATGAGGDEVRDFAAAGCGSDSGGEVGGWCGCDERDFDALNGKQREQDGRWRGGERGGCGELNGCGAGIERDAGNNGSSGISPGVIDDPGDCVGQTHQEGASRTRAICRLHARVKKGVKKKPRSRVLAGPDGSCHGIPKVADGHQAARETPSERWIGLRKTRQGAPPAQLDLDSKSIKRGVGRMCEADNTRRGGGSGMCRGGQCSGTPPFDGPLQGGFEHCQETGPVGGGRNEGGGDALEQFVAVERRGIEPDDG